MSAASLRKNPKYETQLNSTTTQSLIVCQLSVNLKDIRYLTFSHRVVFIVTKRSLETYPKEKHSIGKFTFYSKRRRLPLWQPEKNPIQPKVQPRRTPFRQRLSATTTDLSQEQIQSVTQTVNPLIADAFALYVKTKNFHWHLSGSHFREYHRLFDQQAKTIFDSIDIMAERVRKIGGTTIRSIGQISQLQTINDDNEGFVPPGEMVRRLMDDNAHITQNIRTAIEVCEHNKDFATSNELENILDQTERRKWFLYEIVQGEDNTK